jgi:hypothetical protein
VGSITQENNMKTLSLVVAAGLALGLLAGCGPEDAQPAEAEATQGPRYVATRADGSLVTIRDATGENLASAQDIDGERTVNAQGCWVTLQWCSEPGTGDAVCTQNGQCTLQQFVSACLSLIDDICG